MLLSCTYCCYNPMQHDALGTPYGYCVLREAILKQPAHTTCGWQRRRDLSLADAEEAQRLQAEAFPGGGVFRLPDRSNGPAGAALLDRDLKLLDNNPVASTVRNWQMDTKVATLANLNAQADYLRSPLAEAALTGLGRAYVANCTHRGGNWTSGLHLVAWLRRRLADVPEVGVDQLWRISPTGLTRQTQLAAWSLMMARLAVIDDVAKVPGSELGGLSGVLDDAAEASPGLSPQVLRKWIRKELLPKLARELPEARYRELAHHLHRDEAEGAPVGAMGETPRESRGE